MSEMVELLAPVGCEENFYAAINYGANAIYLGLSDFSARKNAGNFTIEKLQYYLAYAHLFNVKVYVAVNTVIKNSELNKYFECIKQAYELGVDAFIVQDIFLGRELKRRFPNAVLHLSTQAGINNLDGAKQAVSYGFKRVILARETPISEIKKIAQVVETEVFVHGALCTCFSGHCYFSSFIGGKSGNRGACRQPCRKLYKYQGVGIKDDYRYALSLADLAMPNKINELIAIGIKSFKIEGRMRSFEYVCTACDFYRELIDGNFNKLKFDSLKRCYNRGDYTEGLAYGQNKSLISDKVQNHLGVKVGKIAGISGNRLTLSSMRHKLAVGDCFKIISNGYEIGNAFTVEENGKAVVKYSQNATVGSELAITKDTELSLRLKDKKLLHEVKAVFYARVGERLKLTVNGREFISDFIAIKAINSAVTKSEVKENLRKTDVYPFNVIPSCDITSDLFIPKKELNALRANAYKTYFYSFASSNVNECKKQDLIEENKINYEFKKSENQSAISIISNDFSFKIPSLCKNLIFCPEDYNDSNCFKRFFEQTHNFDAIKYLYVPAFLTESDEQIIKNVSADFDGLYCEGASALFLAKRLKKQFFGGIELNVTNALTYETLESEGASEIALSKELSANEISKSNGWVLTLGSVKIMSLMYCPFGKNCADCKRENTFTLKDEDGREFFVRRYKLSECRFEVYNCNLLKSKFKFDNQIFDFTMLNYKQANSLISHYLYGKEINISKGFTIGNLAKGVE